MHFGEYELSPSLISLSPLPSVHWNTFQRIPIRTSSWCYPTFILTKGRSLGFASTHSDYHALLRLAFASAPGLKPLTLPEKVTRRFIMQKARRHNQKIAPTACRQTVSGTISLLCSRCFSPFLHSTGSLSVSREYLALRDGPRWFTQNFSCSALLRIPLGFVKESYTGLSPSTAVCSKTFYFLNLLPQRGPTTPTMPKHHRFGLFRVRSPLLAESLLFSSPMGT